MDTYHAAQCLEQLDWTFAKTMPKNPHWYTLRKDWESDDLFCQIVQYIRDVGRPVKHWRQTYTILEMNGYRYWTMGCTLDKSKTPHTRLINKAAIVYGSEYANFPEDGDKELYVEKPPEGMQDLIGSLDLQGAILEVACRTGMVLDQCKLEPENYTGIDTSLKLLEQLKNKHPNFKDNVICSSFDHFYKSSFDRIVWLFVGLNYISKT